MDLCEELLQYESGLGICNTGTMAYRAADAILDTAPILPGIWAVEWKRTGQKKRVRFSADPACEYDYEWRHLPTGDLYYFQPYQDPNGWVPWPFKDAVEPGGEE
jgi:hypothetical protein